MHNTFINEVPRVRVYLSRFLATTKRLMDLALRNKAS